MVDLELDLTLGAFPSGNALCQNGLDTKSEFYKAQLLSTSFDFNEHVVIQTRRIYISGHVSWQLSWVLVVLLLCAIETQVPIEGLHIVRFFPRPST